MSRQLYTILGKGLTGYKAKREGQERVVLGQVRLNNITLQAFQRALNRHTSLPVVASKNNSRALPGFIVTLTTDAKSVSDEDIEKLVKALSGHVHEVQNLKPNSPIVQHELREASRRRQEDDYFNRPRSYRR